MKDYLRLFKLLSDESRLRTLLLLAHRELCVCQLMGVLGIPQPLVSRNLALLREAGLLDERREGKLVFYSAGKKAPRGARTIIDKLREQLSGDETLTDDLKSLSDCTEFQKRTGKCDMKTFLAYMERRRKDKRKKEDPHAR